MQTVVTIATKNLYRSMYDGAKCVHICATSSRPLRRLRLKIPHNLCMNIASSIYES